MHSLKSYPFFKNSPQHISSWYPSWLAISSFSAFSDHFLSFIWVSGGGHALCLCGPRCSMLLSGLSLACPMSLIWLWHLRSWAVFPSLHTPQALTLCSMPSASMPNSPHSGSGSTACYHSQGIIPAGWPEGEEQGRWRALGRAGGRGRNRSRPPKGQRQALGHIQSYREWWAMGKSCSYTEVTHTAMQLNDRGSDTALSQSAYFKGKTTPWWGKHLERNLVQRIEKFLELASTALSGPVWFSAVNLTSLSFSVVLTANTYHESPVYQALFSAFAYVI